MFLLQLACMLLFFDISNFIGFFFQEQKFLIGVILMVPCYAVESVILFQIKGGNEEISSKESR